MIEYSNTCVPIVVFVVRGGVTAVNTGRDVTAEEAAFDDMIVEVPPAAVKVEQDWAATRARLLRSARRDPEAEIHRCLPAPSKCRPDLIPAELRGLGSLAVKGKRAACHTVYCHTLVGGRHAAELVMYNGLLQFSPAPIPGRCADLAAVIEGEQLRTGARDGSCGGGGS